VVGARRSRLLRAQRKLTLYPPGSQQIRDRSARLFAVVDALGGWPIAALPVEQDPVYTCSPPPLVLARAATADVCVRATSFACDPGERRLRRRARGQEPRHPDEPLRDLSGRARAHWASV
jgi:hypothetical protein